MAVGRTVCFRTSFLVLAISLVLQTHGAAQTVPNRVNTAAKSAYREVKEALAAKQGRGLVKSKLRRWIPAAKAGPRVGKNGGIRLRALGRARVVEVLTPATQGTSLGFDVERLYGIGAAPFAGSTLRDLLKKVEIAYDQTATSMVDLHLDLPRPEALGPLAVDAIANESTADDPVSLGRKAIAALLGGRDRWTVFQLPQRRQNTATRRDRDPGQSVMAGVTNDSIAVVKISSFTRDIAAYTRDQLAGRQLRGIVLDMRQNGGGMVIEARRLLELFASDNRVLMTEAYRTTGGATKTDTWRAANVGPWANLPVMVLVDENTASASEIVAAGLLDMGATIVGTTTFGKGVLQQLITTADDSGLRITAGQLNGPRTSWNGFGIAPSVTKDALISQGQADAAQWGNDSELAGTVAQLRKMIGGG